MNNSDVWTPKELVHTDEKCILLALRICCENCGYPMTDARYTSVEEYLSE